jgi:hypothetical protein
MESKRNGAILRLSSQTVPSWMQHPLSESDSHRSRMEAESADEYRRAFPMNGRNSFAMLSRDTQVGTARTSVIEHAGTHPLSITP